MDKPIKKQINFFHSVLLLIAVTIVLMTGAFLNKYPIVTSDSGIYIDSGLFKYLPFDRPVIYGLFISYTSFFNSLWPVIFCQSLILAYVLIRTVKSLLSNNTKTFIFSLLVILSFISGV